ncbi:hypothetical protein IW492_01885 [Enterococcus sp. BWB1-3]|uniref:hypothetical protein n=1 Tax=unclassified Enterococcus TaxID=2608891 RepID=UPI001921B99A|nr:MULTISPECIES: hypothetical protein [unclassified Enterococcus]MBL1227979.1 hypothetical protein [Enterococcus sp. BWB1-3]MCB5954020.1 hypothetical protein [Enterococcus sp. CWB-B31]
MKKIILSFLVFGAVVSLAACNSSEDKANILSSTKETSTIVSTVDSSAKEDEKMREMERDLEEKGVIFKVFGSHGYLYFNREKSIDYDYFEMRFLFSEKTDKIIRTILELKGNIDGEKKDLLYFDISQGRIVEAAYSNTNINELAEVLESLGYSDKEILEFAQWYYDNNK